MIYEIVIPKESAQHQFERGSAIVRIGRSKHYLVAAPLAGDRLADTIARALTERRSLEPAIDEPIVVGYYDDHDKVLRLSAAGTRPLERWLGRVVYRNELEARDCRRVKREQARRRARSLQLQGRTNEATALRAEHHVWHW